MSEFTRRRRWIKFRNQINVPLTLNPFVFSKSFFMWIALGIIGGIVAGLYWIVIDHLMELTKMFTAGWQVISIMGAGGFIIGLIIHYRGDPGELDIVVNNVRFDGGRLDRRHNASMIATSALGIGVGSSAGPEAPMVQVIGSIGSWFAEKLKLKGGEKRSMSIAGMAVGFSTMFGSVIGGSVFALEIMHHKNVTQYYRSLIPAFVTAGTGFLIFQLITQMGIVPVWGLPFDFEIGTPSHDILWGVGYGIAGTLIGWLIVWTFRSLKKVFKKFTLPYYFQTTLSGLILGVLAWKFPITRYFSHYEVIQLLHGDWTLGLLCALLFIKIFSMALTVTSGWRGGFIVPIFFIGATLGMIVFQVIPVEQNLGLAIVCCMVAVNSCVTRTLIGSVLLVATLTGYASIIPILFAGLTGFFLAPRSPFIALQVGEGHATRGDSIHGEEILD